MTSISAETFGIKERGRVTEGFHADLVLFNPETVTDTATYDDPKQYPGGIELVIVNGKVAFREGACTDASAGQALRYRREAYAE